MKTKRWHSPYEKIGSVRKIPKEATVVYPPLVRYYTHMPIAGRSLCFHYKDGDPMKRMQQSTQIVSYIDGLADILSYLNISGVKWTVLLIPDFVLTFRFRNDALIFKMAYDDERWGCSLYNIDENSDVLTV